MFVCTRIFSLPQYTAQFLFLKSISPADVASPLAESQHIRHLSPSLPLKWNA
jgi:hypothetical protein